MTNKSEIKIIMDLVQLLKQKEDKIVDLERSARYSRPHNQFLRFGGGSRRNADNAELPTQKKNIEQKPPDTSLEEPLILK